MNFRDFLRWVDPHTWPIIVYFWIAIFSASGVGKVWDKLQRRRRESWPLATGEITGASLEEKTRRFGSKFRAEIHYVYSISGRSEIGVYRREFGTEAEGLDLVRDMRGQSVAVHYNPAKPTSSALSDPSLESVLQNRAPRPTDELLPLTPSSGVVILLNKFLWPLAILSAVGFAVSVWRNISALMGRSGGDFGSLFAMQCGAIALFSAACAAAKPRFGDVNDKRFWKLLQRESGAWMQSVSYGLSGYAMLTIAFIFFQKSQQGTTFGPEAWLTFSGFWMVFYFMAFAVFYASILDDQAKPHCVNGHVVTPGAIFCTICGQSVSRN